MENKKQLRNTLMLVVAALIWGTAFVAQSVGSGYMGPYTFLASRSWLACAFLLGLMGVRRANQRRQGKRLPFWVHGKTLAIGGALCGVALFAASAAQQMGIGTTSTAKAGFMTALYVVLVPVCGIFLGSRPGVKLWACVAVSVVGLYLLCLAGRDTLSLTGGEWQLLLCAFLFTLQILLVNRFSPRLDGIQLSFAQFLAVSVLSTVCMFLFEQPTPAQFAGGGGVGALLRRHVQRRGLHPADRGPAGTGPHHRQPGHVPGERLQRPGRLAHPGPDPHRPPNWPAARSCSRPSWPASCPTGNIAGSDSAKEPKKPIKIAYCDFGKVLRYA